ncbi:MAG: efflux RND transporter permease subunit [Deferribacteraceae bacterium]|jgi:HAE1 family hydrophobic/amphiphilic exporter-1|nr:efflux RND transporter permease subunit [Deferribacteraceae bacterium]
MDIVKYALNNPVKVFVAILLIALFGIQALLNMPYQLNPSVEYPTITVRTNWVGATPYEIEREVIERQENVLKSLSGLIEMESVSGNGFGSITLQFQLGTPLMEAMLLVSNKLNEVRVYPENVEKPVIRASGSDPSPVIFMLFTLNEGNTNVIDSYRTYVSDDIVPRFERVEGVAEVFFYGGRPTQMQVTIAPEKMAAYNIPVDKLANALTQDNVNFSGGLLAVGRKNYRVRMVSEYTSIDDIKETLIISERGGVKVSDVAEVAYGFAKSDSAVRYEGGRTMMIGIIPEINANVLALTDEVEAVVKRLNDGTLKDQGIFIKWVYDQRPYINGAIDLVKSNIWLGGILAIVVLLIFLRCISSTVVVAAAIPISILGTFIVLRAFGRTLNVISLAGIAFAVGMLIDNAIVVLENIDRHRLMGKSPMQAAYEGSVEVWGAVLASTLTTVAVFLPVVFVKQEAGQLFRDIAIAVSAAILLSLMVSVLVIPVLSHLIYEKFGGSNANKVTVWIADKEERIKNNIMKLSVWINSLVKRKVAVVVILTGFSLCTLILLSPKMEYLPQGNMNNVQSVFIIPAGLSLDERSELGDIFYNLVKPYIGEKKDGYPAIRTFNYNVNPNGMTAMATAVNPEKAYELVPLLTKLMRSIPGITGFTNQIGIFQNRSGGGRSIDIVVSGEDIYALADASRSIMRGISSKIQNAQVRPRPSVDMFYPEATFRPIYQRLRDAGMTPSALGIAINVYVDGRKVSEFSDSKLGNIDLVVRVPETLSENPEDVAFLPLVASDGQIIPISSVADLDLTFGMEGIRRYERKRAFTLSVSPPVEMALEQLIDAIRDEIVAPLKAEGSLDGIEVRYAGSASKLVQAREVLQGNFIVALIITFLLMSALFNSFFYPLIVMFTVPLAMAGGFIGLKLVNIFIAPQPFDILTMLGFVLLLGVVVNNAILILHQSLNNINYGIPAQEAISQAVNDRLRPIFMSAATSLFGMLPLVVFPGPGSELYRGLGSVILGGLTVSTVFTIFMIPALLSLLINVTKR